MPSPEQHRDDDRGQADNAAIQARRFQIRQIHAALVHSGIDPDTLLGLADLTTLDNLRTVLRFFLKRGTGRGSSQTAGIATAFAPSPAKKWLPRKPQNE